MSYLGGSSSYEGCERIGFLVPNHEDTVEFGDCEDLVDYWDDFRQPELAAELLQSLAKSIEHADGGRGEKFDPIKTHNNFGPAIHLDEVEQFFFCLSDAIFVFDLRLIEGDNSHIILRTCCVKTDEFTPGYAFRVTHDNYPLCKRSIISISTDHLH